MAASTFGSITKRIEERAKELAAWEVILKDRKVVMDEMYSIKEDSIKKEKAEVEKRIEELKGLDERWRKTETLMAANAAAVADTLTLNIGGQKFTTSKAILTQYKDSYFTDLFSSSTAAKLKGRFYVEREPKYFGSLLQFMKGGGIDYSVDRQGLKDEFEFYRIPFPDKETPQKPKVNPSTIHHTLTLPIQIAPLHKEEAARHESNLKLSFFEGELLPKWKDVVQTWLPDQHFILIYKGTQDGFSPTAYHTACDFSCSTFVVIQSTEGFIFGGYSRISTNRELLASSFLYTLTNPNSIPPSTYPLQQGNWRASGGMTKNICLGGKKLNLHDIRLSENCNLDNQSKCFFPTTFTDTTGKGNLTFTGTATFGVKEVEILHVVPVRRKWIYDTKGYMILTKQFEKIIQKWLPSNNFTLRYKSSQHGLKFADFQKRLAPSFPSLVLCQTTKGHVFGAYSYYLPFASVSKHRAHATNFLFTLTNPHTIPPTRYFPSAGPDLFSRDFIGISSMESVDCCVGGVDIVLEKAYFEQNDTVTCQFHFPYSFVDTSGKGNRTFTGTDRAVIRDIEVYSVQ
eukprot:Phypoly_transcript_06018.p1 GENE.Phypoly_transcript_06018~~Phypoly_transcript_06018.p1  ORF type:complete len:619 (+),score=110.07 Phypoly_transcript_06018:150-1859(+)